MLKNKQTGGTGQNPKKKIKKESYWGDGDVQGRNSRQISAEDKERERENRPKINT